MGGLGSGVGKEAADEIVQVALPELLKAVGTVVGELNTRVLELTELGNKILAALNAERTITIENPFLSKPIVITLRAPKL